MKRISLFILKISVIILLVWYIGSNVNRAALLTTFSSIHPLPALAGFICLGIAACISSQRWRLLMRAQAMVFSFRQTLRLTFIGMFYNTFMPGLTGGDIVKSWYLSRQSRSKTTAIMTVVVDRIAGIFGLALLGAVVLSLSSSNNSAIFTKAGYILYGFLGAALCAGLIFFSARIRRLVSFDRLISKLPFAHIVSEADRAVLIYRQHGYCVLKVIFLSVLIHSVSIFGMYLFGVALAIDSAAFSYGGMLALIPSVFILSSLSITPAGLGVGESLSIFFLASLDASAEQALAIMLLFRVGQIIWGLCGGLSLLVGEKQKSFKEIEAEMEVSE